MCGSAPSAPQLPQYPGMTAGETNITNQQTNALNTQGNMINTVSGQLSNNQNILQMISGLFNQDGTINQNALTQLQQQSQASTQTAGQAGQAQLAGMAGTQGAENATASAYTNALNNGAPANQQIAYQQNQNFLQMQQQAAQQGITINGTSAVSDGAKPWQLRHANAFELSAIVHHKRAVGIKSVIVELSAESE